jgi:hypothetical protein
MSLELSHSCPRVTAKTCGLGSNPIFLFEEGGRGIYWEIPLSSFCDLVEVFIYGNEILANPWKATICQSGDAENVKLRHLGQEVVMSFGDYVSLVVYVFTNTDLTNDDPRISVVNRCIFGEKSPGEGKKKELFDWLADLDSKDGWNSVFNSNSTAKRFGTFDLPKV